MSPKYIRISAAKQKLAPKTFRLRSEYFACEAINFACEAENFACETINFACEIDFVSPKRVTGANSRAWVS
jgi:hypothetical protein